MNCSRSDFQWLAKTRLREAKALLDKGLFDGSYYLAGYAVECALKASIVKKIKRSELPDKDFINRIYTHSLGELVKLADLQAEYTKAKQDKQFEQNWNTVKDWNEKARYETLGRWSYRVSWVSPRKRTRQGTRVEKRARALYDAISNKNHGVLSWLKKFW
jgi:HEPN domain-containing protein